MSEISVSGLFFGQIVDVDEQTYKLSKKPLRADRLGDLVLVFKRSEGRSRRIYKFRQQIQILSVQK